MNLGDSAIVLRPRGLSEIFDLAFRLCSSVAFRLYGWLALWTLLPILAGCLALRYAADWSWGVIWLLVIAAEPFAEGAYTVAASRVIFAPDITARSVLHIFGGRLSTLIGSLFVRLVALAITPFTFFVLLPFVVMRLLFLDEACLLEGLNVPRAMERSQQLIRGRGGDAFMTALLLFVSRFALVIAAEILVDGLLDDVLQLGQPFGSLFSDGGSPASIAGYLLSAPFVATARFLSYIDTRTRSDGWDIQLRFTAIMVREEEGRRKAA